MLVLRLGEAVLSGQLGDSLLVGDDWVGLLQLALGILVLQVVQADFDVQLTAAGDDVLSSGLGDADDQGVGLRQALEALDQLGQV